MRDPQFYSPHPWEVLLQNSDLILLWLFSSFCLLGNHLKVIFLKTSGTIDGHPGWEMEAGRIDLIHSFMDSRAWTAKDNNKNHQENAFPSSGWRSLSSHWSFHLRCSSFGVTRALLGHEALNSLFSGGNSYRLKGMADPSGPAGSPGRPHLCWRGLWFEPGRGSAVPSTPECLSPGAGRPRWGSPSSPSRGIVLETPSTVWQRQPFLGCSAKKQIVRLLLN